MSRKKTAKQFTPDHKLWLLVLAVCMIGLGILIIGRTKQAATNQINQTLMQLPQTATRY